MASSTASQGGYSRRRRNVGRQPLQRTNTIFGAIKNIVTAPLSWFANTDDFEDTRDGMGKRRRLAAVPTEIDLEDDRPSRTKRIRVDSPPRESQQEGYLDPPASAFLKPQPIGRSVSAGKNHFISTGDNGNYSVDKGTIPSQRSLAAVHEMDSSMESVHALPNFTTPSVPAFPRSSLSVPRDISMSSSRPAFRMRTSLTPQPQQVKRDKSEPPPLQSLMANPTFVRPPPVAEETPSAVIESTATLGTLVESVRKARSPSSHGSLLFASRNQPETSTAGWTPAEKALHELEIYKTPLVPTRLRSGNLQSSITGVPDLFKPRRHSKLVLMKDEKGSGDRKLGRKEVSSPEKNVTKPYAGEGGMKKMLAKRKLELEDDDEEGSGKKDEKGLKQAKEEKPEQKERIPDLPSADIPPAPKQDWYSLASGPSAHVGGSSLRVGRVKTSRNHISRPTARPRSKFSAAFDDDDGDDTMGDEGDKEKQMLEEAAKKAPAFSIPAGFSFANDVKPIEHDNSSAKEPPIKSLPFSFSSPPTALKPASADTSIPQSSFSTPPATSLPFSFGLPPAAPQEKPASFFGLSPNQPPSAPPMSTSGGVPNFFAQSAALSKPLEIKTQPLTFGPTSEPPKAGASAQASIPTFLFSSPPSTDKPSSAATSLVASATPTAPVKDSANPLWDGEKKTDEGSIFKDLTKDKAEPTPFSFFGAASQKEGTTSAVPETKDNPAPASVFGNVSKSSASSAPFSIASNDSGIIGASKPPQLTIETSVSSGSSLFGNKPTAEGGASHAPGSLFGGQLSATAFGSTNKGQLFGSTDAHKAVIPSFSAPLTEGEKPNPPAATTPAASPFTFGHTSASEARKPAVATTPFSFGQGQTISDSKPASPAPFAFGSPNDNAKPAPAPFSFGSSDTDAKAGSPAPFTFGGTPTTTENPSVPFSFGAPASPAPQTSSIFTFNGGTATPSKPSAPERPTTPPKSGDQEFKMEESPTREVHQINENNKPAFGGGFSFGNNPPSGSVLFGGPLSATSTTSPFTFGGSTPSPNPFAPPQIKEAKSEEPKPFSFGQPSSSTAGTSFSFGQTQSSEAPRPSTTGSFNFGNSSTPTTTTSSFNFGVSPTTNPFGQPAGGSAPSSPSTFQSSGFNFGAPSTNTPFGFGSQPASPAGSNNALPSAATPVTFGSSNTGFGSSAPSSPFSAPAQIAPSTSSGGTLFTIGAAPPPTATNAQGRTIRKLPNRARAKR